MFFSYAPAKSSELFKNYEPAKRIDKNTISGVYRKNAPFYGNFYEFRFISELEVSDFWDKDRFEIRHLEKLQRTYNHMSEKFDFIVFEAKKI